MTLSLAAYLNQRFQWTVAVDDVTAIYGDALNDVDTVWFLQIRQFEGSPVVTLDFRTGGSPQSEHLTATYDSTSKMVTFQGPTSIVAQYVAAGDYAFDFGFVLPDADFERVDGGLITFRPGVTLAGVPGAPEPPDMSRDTVKPAAITA